MYYYTAFGLNITSAIPFPELLESSFQKEDVVIELGKVPLQLQNEKHVGNQYSSANNNEFLWEVEDVCKYYASNGNKIIIEPCKAAENRSIRLYLLATVMASVLNQRDTISLHASAVKINGKLSLITGDSGAGKSTTLAGLLKKRYQIFSDDIIVIKEDDDKQIRAFASYPMMKLWDDAIIKLRDKLFDDRSFPVMAGMDKYGIFFHKQFDTGAYPIERIFVINLKDSGNIETRRLENVAAFKEVNLNVYRPNLLYSNDLRRLNFTTILNLVKEAKVIEIIRPQQCDPNDLVATIEMFLENEQNNL